MKTLNNFGFCLYLNILMIFYRPPLIDNYIYIFCFDIIYQKM
ncbi:Uncharacterised protein [Segatella copri]|nr:Uncharacterised protein [Segatella copri]